MFAQFLSDGWRIFVDFQWLDLTDLGWGVEKVAWRDNLPASRPCSQYQVTSDRIFFSSAEKLFTSLLIVCKERSSIHIYSVYFTVYLLWESPWIAYRVSILYNNHAVMIDHPLRVKILSLSTINMIKVTMIWKQQWISRAIVIFFMQCGFAFLEAGSVRSASTSSSHHCQCFLVHIYKYISMLGIVHHLWTDNWSNWFWRNVNHSSLVKGCGGGKSFYIGKETNMEVFYILNISTGIIQLVLEWKP